MEMAIGIHSSLSVSLSITPNPSTMLAAPTALLPKQLLGRTLSTISSTKRLSNPNSCVARLLPTSVQCSVSEATEFSTSKKSGMLRRADIRNIAIVAHVDHGKTTLVDSMLKQAKVVRDDQAVQERIMDSNDLEKERGITILSKITSITYKNTKINIIDTPGDSGYGGEVERILNMVEGILLVVDSVEGPMPQTRFVIKKALEFGHAVIVVVNKIDRPSARPDYVISSTFELFIELNATDEQCDFQVIYASGINGKAGLSPQKLADDLGPLFESVIRCIPGPRISKDDNLQMLATNIEYEEHKGRIAIGRLHAGVLKRGMDVRVCTTDDSCRSARVSELFVYENFYRVPVESVEAGEICAVCGISDIQDPMDVIELSDDSRISLDACLSVSNITSICEGYYNSNNDGDSFVDLSFHSRSSTSTAAVSPPPKQPPPPRQGGDDGGNDDSDNDDNDNKYDFQAKALFLDSIGIDPLSVLSRDPSALASASLLELKQLFGYLSSLGLSPSDLRRMASMHPAVLSLRLRDAASVCSFLIREAHVALSGLRRALHRRPRLLLSPVSSRLRPTLYFLQSLGIHDVARHTDLLSCSVEDKFLPRLEYFQRLGFSYRDSVSMFRRFPPLFCYSIRDNFEPKFNYFVVDMGRELKELREFPQYFSFSLDKRIKPRHQMCVHKGVYFPLNVMLKTTEEEFQRRLGVSVDSSLPVRDSPLWCTNMSSDVNATLQLDDDDGNIL